ncbi:hypothetical protein D3C81_2063370 [compost metagenome]
MQDAGAPDQYEVAAFVEQLRGALRAHDFPGDAEAHAFAGQVGEDTQHALAPERAFLNDLRRVPECEIEVID